MRKIAFLCMLLTILSRTAQAQSWELIYETPQVIELACIQVVEDSTIWVGGSSINLDPYLAVSKDYGQSWEDLSSQLPDYELANRVRSLHFFNGQEGVLGYWGNDGKPYYTEDGGQSWEPCDIDYAGIEPFPVPIIFNFAFKDSLEGWAFHGGNPAAVLHTIDGGKSWEVQLRREEDLFRDLAYHSGDTLISMTREHLMYTHDGGQSWVDIEDNLYQDRWSAFFISRQRGWWGGLYNKTHTTNDGGVSWSTATINAAISDISVGRDIGFANDTLGWLCLDVLDLETEYAGMYITTDGGESWSQQNPPIFIPRALEVCSDTLAYACTREGKVYRYRGRPASCLPAGSLAVSDSSSLYPLLSWQPAAGAYDGYYLQLGTTPGGEELLPRTSLGLDTFYQATAPLPEGTAVYATVLPYNHVYGAAEGCGSMAFTTPACPPAVAIDTGFCKGEALLWGDSLIVQPGQYAFAGDTLPSGCVESFSLQVEQYPQKATVFDTAYCAGEAFYWQDSLLPAPGLYQFSYASAQGCDSTVTVKLGEHPAALLRIDTFFCAGEAYSGQDTVLDSPGTYTFHYEAAQGCDSLVELQLSERPHRFTEIDTALAPGEQYDGQAYEGDTTLVYHLAAANGCDSTVTVNITVVTGTRSAALPGWRAYPVPARGELWVEGPQPARRLLLYSPAGQAVRREELPPGAPGRHRLPLSGLPAGLYFLEVQGDWGNWVVRVLVE